MTKDEALKRIAAYPFSRAEELSVEQMREIAREALQSPQDVSEDTNNEQVEPVAWLVTEGYATPNMTFANIKSAEIAQSKMLGSRIVPLYIHPPVPTAQPEQEQPVAWLIADGEDLWATNEKNMMLDYPKSQVTPLYTTPPQRKPLTDEQREQIYNEWCSKRDEVSYDDLMLAVEAAHGIKE